MSLFDKDLVNKDVYWPINTFGVFEFCGVLAEGTDISGPEYTMVCENFVLNTITYKIYYINPLKIYDYGQTKYIHGLNN